MFLGIDTSAYTTSIALIKDEKAILDKRLLLEVPTGGRGLRQSEAVFQHVKNLITISDELDGYHIDAIGVSSKPTPEENSYMPVFKVGESVAKFNTKLNNIPIFNLSHQEGHIAAGLWSTKTTKKNILAIHISGGTTEFLQVKNEDFKFKIKLLGNSTDLHAGQFIDRIGVTLGSSFPAGPQMDLWAQRDKYDDVRIPSSTKGNFISFSGPETFAQKLIKNNYTKESIANATFICIARSIEKVIRNIYEKNKYDIILLVGGVARNSIIKKELTKRLPYQLAFCDEKYSSDNAVGLAFLAEKYFNQI
ncbi:MAG: O-sialoglycoprotein endopeptidase [Clostridia bacterium]